MCKVFESFIRDVINDHLHNYELINRSCLTNLLEFLKTITDLVDRGLPINIVYLDFQKAFDKVLHKCSISKIEAHGIGGKIINWIKDWLRGRRQRVVLNSYISDWADVLSGVSQGSVLGPLLFVNLSMI